MVIRNAHQIHHSHFKVGLVTQKVTTELNVIGAAALILMLWNTVASWRPSGPWVRRGLAASLVVAIAAHGAVYLIHGFLDGLLSPPSPGMSESATFHRPHEAYLVATAVEWTAGLVYLLAALMAWRQEDSAASRAR